MFEPGVGALSALFTFGLKSVRRTGVKLKNSRRGNGKHRKDTQIYLAYLFKRRFSKEMLFG